MSPTRKWDADDLIKAAYETKKVDESTVLFLCKGEKDGEVCPFAVEIDVEPDGSIEKGFRNNLVQHARAHGGGNEKYRRVSR